MNRFLPICAAFCILALSNPAPLWSSAVHCQDLCCQSLIEIDHKIQTERRTSVTSSLLVEKAKLLIKSQRLAEALETFLLAIEKMPTSEQGVSEQEKKFCVGFSDLEELEKLCVQYPRFLSLELYRAELLLFHEQFEKAFESFLRAYPFLPDHFLTWKILSMLHVRLFETVAEPLSRKDHREKACACLQEAFSRNSQDPSLVHDLISTCPFAERKQLFSQIVLSLVARQEPLRRRSCWYLIEQAIVVGALKQARALLEQAKLWHGYSRVLNELSQTLNVLESNGSAGEDVCAWSREEH